MYKIIFDKKVIEFLARIEKIELKEIFDNLELIKNNPFIFNIHKISNTHSIEINNYKLILDINDILPDLKVGVSC